jgi:hypothetical protein
VSTALDPDMIQALEDTHGERASGEGWAWGGGLGARACAKGSGGGELGPGPLGLREEGQNLDSWVYGSRGFGGPAIGPSLAWAVVL